MIILKLIFYKRYIIQSWSAAGESRPHDIRHRGDGGPAYAWSRTDINACGCEWWTDGQISRRSTHSGVSTFKILNNHADSPVLKIKFVTTP